MHAHLTASRGRLRSAFESADEQTSEDSGTHA
jgi:hypothetical protein